MAASLSSHQPLAQEGGLAALLAYISQLGVHDIEKLQARNLDDAASGSHSDHPLNDEEVAMRLFAAEAESLLNITKDHITGVPDGVQCAPGSLIHELLAVEDMARRDHMLAIALSESGELREDVEAVPSSGQAARADSGSGSSSGTQSTEARSLALAADPVQVCTACADDIHGTSFSTACGHVYDRQCLQDFFRKATVDEAVFPPSCCAITIPFENARQLLDTNLAILFENKVLEYSTANRVYCYQPQCSTFLGAATSTPVPLNCPECLTQTCSACKEEAHGSRGCSAHLNQAVLDMAKENGWQRCPGCHHLVELTHGCYHMQCMCKKQFCYVCGVTWKECACPQFAEDRLYAAERL